MSTWIVHFARGSERRKPWLRAPPTDFARSLLARQGLGDHQGVKVPISAAYLSPKSVPEMQRITPTKTSLMGKTIS